MTLVDFLKVNYQKIDVGFFVADIEGYWSNLNKKENKNLIASLEHNPAREVLKKYHPDFEDVIFSPKRQAGLEMLQLSGDEVCIDYGCMWGALTIPLARRTRLVLGIDQTLESLQFLKARLRDDSVDNVVLLRNDLRKMPLLPEGVRVDVAIVNGVLEWIPETGTIELGSYFGKHHKKKYFGNPKEQQELFLRRVYENLNEKGKLYLAIENRFDFKMFFGIKDPHSDTIFTTIAPRKLANLISLMKLGRPYVNWLYSFNGINSLLKKAGFSKIDLYRCSPDYRFPESIVHHDYPMDNSRLIKSWRNEKRKITFRRSSARMVEFVLKRILKVKSLAPSIVAIGYK
jgi:hypothetical protein